VNAEGSAEGARELILAVFRLAVADYMGVSYDYDEPVRQRLVSAVHRVEAAAFFRSPWAACLGDLIGLSSATIWRKARRQLEQRHGLVSIPARSSPRLASGASNGITKS
jgi:hypothetical protein